MTTTGTARFQDGPDNTFDAADVLFTAPAGVPVELRRDQGARRWS